MNGISEEDWGTLELLGIRHPEVLALIAEVEAKTYEVEALRAMGRGLIKELDAAQIAMNTHSCGENVEAVYRRTIEAERERDEARAEVEALQAWQAQTVRRVRDTVDSEHFTMLVVEDIPNADFGELIDALVEQRDEARAEVERWKLGTDCPICAKEYPQYPYTDEHLAGWRAAFKWVHHAHERRDGRIDGNGVLGATPDCIVVDEDWMNEQFWQRDARADRAEAALGRVREAATEVTNQGDNHGRTHYNNCWKYHLHCLAAKIIYETGEDDD